MSLRERFLDRGEVKELDTMPVGELMSIHQDYSIVTRYAEGQGYWRVGDGRPREAFDDPVMAQAAGRCVAARVRGVPIQLGSIHPATCRSCKTAITELLPALDHAVYLSRFVATEYVAWPTRGDLYIRDTGRAATYENPAWASFFALDREDRRLLVEAAMYGEAVVR